MRRLLQIFCLFSVLTACSSRPATDAAEDDALVTVGDSTLHESDVVRRIPAGLAEADSIELFHSIVDRWIETRVLSEVARQNVVDLSRIDRLTEEYRNRLIVDEYLRKMEGGRNEDVSKEEVDNYYRQFGDSMILEQPLVKGLFLRTSVSDPELGNIRQWIASDSQDDIDRLEKKGLREATGYEYFADRWVEWQEIARRLPVNVGEADSYLAANKDGEFEHNGMVYLLHITDYIPSGKLMPESFARMRIQGILADRRAGEYRKNLRISLYKKAEKEGNLKKGLYDPFERFRK